MPRGHYARKAKPRRDTDRASTNVYPFPRNPDVAGTGTITEDTTVSTLPNAQSMKDQIAMQNIELLTLRNEISLLNSRTALYERLLDRFCR